MTTLTQGKIKPPYQRNKGKQCRPRIVTVPQESDICAVCGWPIGTKQAEIMPNGDRVHTRAKCRNKYKIQ